MGNTPKGNPVNKLEVHKSVLYKTTFRKTNTNCIKEASLPYKYCAFSARFDTCVAPDEAACIYHGYDKHDSAVYIKIRYLKIRNLKEKHCLNRNKK